MHQSHAHSAGWTRERALSLNLEGPVGSGDFSEGELVLVLQRIADLVRPYTYSQPGWLKELRAKLPQPLQSLLYQPDGAALLAAELPTRFPPVDVAGETDQRRAWELAGLFYRNAGRFHEALVLFSALYDHMLAAQEESGAWANKGMPLVWMGDCFWEMGFPVLAKRYRMLALCEDAIRDKGVLSLNISGAYFRLVLYHGLLDAEVKRYAGQMYELSARDSASGLFPEWVLQQIDNAWMTEVPAAQESTFYTMNRRYARHLLSQLGQSGGVALEWLAEYLLSCIPGCRTYRRRSTPSTEYDVVCAMQGPGADFLSELGRYFECECKDWNAPADFTTMAKFCRVLDSTKARFGMLFSRQGISGASSTTDAAREQLKVFQDRGIIIVVVDQGDLARVADGESFLSLLRAKYEAVRLDLT